MIDLQVFFRVMCPHCEAVNEFSDFAGVATSASRLLPVPYCVLLSVLLFGCRLSPTSTHKGMTIYESEAPADHRGVRLLRGTGQIDQMADYEIKERRLIRPGL